LKRVCSASKSDASGAGLGAVLSQVQEDNSIAYASWTLQKHECNYGVTELEALDVVWAVKHCRSYLYIHRYDIYTDHDALKSLLNTPQPLARWGMALQELDLHLHYRPGRANSDADTLSQNAIPDLSDNLIPAVKKVCGPKEGHCEIRCKIQGGSQEMAVMVG